MKSLSLFILVLFSIVASAQDSVKISGKILNPVSDSVEISYNDNLIAYYPKEFYILIDKHGKFTLTFPVPHGRYVQAEIVHGRKYSEIIVQPGDSLVLNADASHFDSSLRYAGRGSSAANFMSLHTIVKGRMNQYTLKIKTDINKEPADFLRSIEMEKKGELDFLNKNKTGLPESFIKYWTAFYQYYNYFFIQQYPQVHEIVKLKKYTDTIPPANFSVLKDMAYAFNDSLLQVPSYLLYLTGVIEIKLKASGYIYLGKDLATIEKMQDSISNLALKLLPDKSAEYYMAQNIYGRARNQDVDRTELQFRAFKKRWPQSSFIPDINNQVSMAKRLAPGQPAPDFEIHTSDGKNMHLSDLKGKVVYLTFWANWCKQCVGEMINCRKVKELIKNKPLEFVYVSISTDTAEEHKIINKFNFQGTFTNTPGIWASKEVQLYGVHALPAYYLIDEDGNFALQNTPTPSQSTQLILAIEKLFR